jgi:hypothetical protein
MIKRKEQIVRVENITSRTTKDKKEMPRVGKMMNLMRVI